MNCTTDYAIPQITPTIRCCSQHLMVGFFFDLFSYSGLRAFFTSYFMNCTTDYALPKLPQPSGAVHSIWWLGFFYTSSPILDLEHFSQVILRIVPPIMPTPQNNPNHQVLFTASDGWVFFLISSPILGLEHFSQVILRIVLQIMHSPNYPNHQVLFTASDGWVFFFWPLLLFWT